MRATFPSPVAYDHWHAVDESPDGGWARGIQVAGSPLYMPIGVDRGDLNRIFERFYRVDHARSREHGGSGIGLAIARALIEAHGGQLWAESPGPGRGAQFLCRLPAA